MFQEVSLQQGDHSLFIIIGRSHWVTSFQIITFKFNETNAMQLRQVAFQIMLLKAILAKFIPVLRPGMPLLANTMKHFAISFTLVETFVVDRIRAIDDGFVASWVLRVRGDRHATNVFFVSIERR